MAANEEEYSQQEETEEPTNSNNLPSYPAPANPVTVIGPQYCTPNPTDLTIQKKNFKVGEGHFSINDMDGNAIFTVNGVKKRVLVDSAGIPVVNMRQKMISAHRRWDVYRGEGSAEPMFSIKKSSLIQFKSVNLEVYLQSNTSEKTCDFKIKGSWQERSCVVTLGGDSKSIIAQMNKEKNTFSVTIYPNVDYAFIVALIVVSYEVNKDKKREVNKDKKVEVNTDEKGND